MTSGKVTRESVVSESVVNCHPIGSASAGKIGRMYDGSFEPDMLKNTKITAVHTSAKRWPLKPFASLGAPVHIRFAAPKNTASQGRMPTTKIGMKYHHAPSRRCSPVRKRVKCS